MRRDRAIRREISADIALLHITDTSRLLKLLKDDNRAIFTAAAKAGQALDYLRAMGKTAAIAA